MNGREREDWKRYLGGDRAIARRSEFEINIRCAYSNFGNRNCVHDKLLRHAGNYRRNVSSSFESFERSLPRSHHRRHDGGNLSVNLSSASSCSIPTLLLCPNCG